MGILCGWRLLLIRGGGKVLGGGQIVVGGEGWDSYCLMRVVMLKVVVAVLAL
jgi:hypothetical protein